MFSIQHVLTAYKTALGIYHMLVMYLRHPNTVHPTSLDAK